MREILFRGQEIRTKEWRFGYILPVEGDSTAVIITHDYLSINNYRVDPSTVGQFTGLLEGHWTKGREIKENPQKIFEGDILKVDLDWPPGGKGCRDGIVGTVIFLDGAFCFSSKPHSKEKRDSRELWDCYNREIIGNVTDNPELLEVNNA